MDIRPSQPSSAEQVGSGVFNGKIDEGNVQGRQAFIYVLDLFAAIAKKIMETRPGLARGEEKVNQNTPMQLAALENTIDVLRVLLEHDRSLGYVVPLNGASLLNSAAFRDHVGVA